MCLFRKKRKQQDALNSIMEKIYQESFPGGKSEELNQIDELSKMLPGYSKQDIGNVLRYASSLFITAQDKSIERIAYNGIMRRPNNPFTKQDAETIYNYIFKKRTERIFGGPGKNIDADALAMILQMANEMSNDGCDTDEIPEGYGEFGREVTNPVPIKGVPAIDGYLRSLKHVSGERFTYKRIGSTSADNIKNPIDIYVITSESGQKLGIIYISAYHKRTSQKAPKDFYI